MATEADKPSLVPDEQKPGDVTESVPEATKDPIEKPAEAEQTFPASAVPSNGDKTLPQWKEKGRELITQSSNKFKEAATLASTAVVEAAEVTSTKVKASWQTNVQPRVNATWQSTVDGWQTSVKPKVEAAARAAAEAGAIIKKSLIDTRDKVASAALHKKIAEATRNSLEKSRSFLVKMEILPPEMNPRAVFGVSLEKVAAYQPPSSPPIPHIVIACTVFIKSQGLTTEYLFEDEGDPAMVTRLMKIYERDDQASIPPGFRPQDVAQVLLAFFRCLPEPILTFQLYDGFVSVSDTDLVRLSELIKGLPAANLATLENVVELLSILAKEEITKVNSLSLATEWAPVLLWKKGGAPASVTPAAEPSPPNQDPASETPKEEAVAAEGAAEADDGSEPANEQKAIAKAVKTLIDNFEAVFKP